jgi:phosphoribosyl-ATP pyrophosphohydrolase/phosphoribosyl-AMP cyclohydrolase
VKLISTLEYKDKGLIPAIAQDADSGEVLMLGYMNEEAVRRTLSSGEMWFYSRSRQELWHKPIGPVCHTGNKTCFFEQLTEQDLSHSEEA